MVVADFGGELPQTMEELTRLPGVGRKTANLVLNDCFGITEGVAVDTHVFRIASRLGLTRAPNPAAAEQDLIALYNTEQLARLNHQWVLFGREVCDARKPRCAECPLQDICPSAFKDPLTKEQAAKKVARRMYRCETDEDCVIVDKDPCGCWVGPSGVTAINVAYILDFNKMTQKSLAKTCPDTEPSVDKECSPSARAVCKEKVCRIVY
jgi:adenine-specific DNA glycosylase